MRTEKPDAKCSQACGQQQYHKETPPEPRNLFLDGRLPNDGEVSVCAGRSEETENFSEDLENVHRLESVDYEL